MCNCKRELFAIGSCTVVQFVNFVWFLWNGIFLDLPFAQNAPWNSINCCCKFYFYFFSVLIFQLKTEVLQKHGLCFKHHRQSDSRKNSGIFSWIDGMHRSVYCLELLFVVMMVVYIRHFQIPLNSSIVSRPSFIVSRSSFIVLGTYIYEVWKKNRLIAKPTNMNPIPFFVECHFMRMIWGSHCNALILKIQYIYSMNKLFLYHTHHLRHAPFSVRIYKFGIGFRYKKCASVPVEKKNLKEKNQIEIFIYRLLCLLFLCAFYDRRTHYTFFSCNFINVRYAYAHAFSRLLDKIFM